MVNPGEPEQFPRRKRGLFREGALSFYDLVFDVVEQVILPCYLLMNELSMGPYFVQ